MVLSTLRASVTFFKASSAVRLAPQRASLGEDFVLLGLVETLGCGILALGACGATGTVHQTVPDSCFALLYKRLAFGIHFVTCFASSITRGFDWLAVGVSAVAAPMRNFRIGAIAAVVCSWMFHPQHLNMM